MHHIQGRSFQDQFVKIRDLIVETEPVFVGTWQSQSIDSKMHELANVALEYQIPDTKEELASETGARLPWAEDHFWERVSGQPLNPAPSEAWWPFRKKSADGDTNKDHKSEGEAFSHTYPERMWPKNAGPLLDLEPLRGIRFAYGDLNDVINQLARDPLTRQAYLPIWFPEDTGAVHGKRVPCTLGYHFYIRNSLVHVNYFMRSTDLLRHFQDDIYLAGRLVQHVVEELNQQTEWAPYRPGTMGFFTSNMHIFDQDVAMINFWKSQGKVWF